MGVWIETVVNLTWLIAHVVTPCMGVWIETDPLVCKMCALNVTPCMGVWIETKLVDDTAEGLISHTLYGCVD